MKLRSTRVRLHGVPHFPVICLHHRKRNSRSGQNHDCWCLDHARCEQLGGAPHSELIRQISKAFRGAGKTFDKFAALCISRTKLLESG